mgnify:CR=1 FL=1
MEKESVKDVILRYGVLLGKMKYGKTENRFFESGSETAGAGRISCGYHLCIRFAHEAGVCKYV